MILFTENVVCCWSQSSDESSPIKTHVWDRRTGINVTFNAEDQFQLSNADTCVNNWIAKRFSSENKVVGIPFYHTSFTIEIPSYINTAITVDLAEPVKSWTRERKSQQKVIYTVKGNHLSGYNDIESIRINQKNLRRILFWSL